MPSRRAVLAGAAGLAVTVGGASQLRLGRPSLPSPAPDTWPLARYDAANRAANTDIDAPANPRLAWSHSVLDYGLLDRVVVGRERVYVGGEGFAALDRADGSLVWSDPGVADASLALAGGRLYVASETATGNGAFELHAVDIATGTRDWTVPLDLEPSHLIAGSGIVLLGSVSGLAVFTEEGDRHWSDQRAMKGGGPALHDGDLYYTGQPLIRYRRRSLLDTVLSWSPKTRWVTRGPPYFVTPPAVDGNRLFVGSGLNDRGPALFAISAHDGSIDWSVLDGYSETDNRALAPAVAGGRVYTGSVHGEGESRRHFVTAFARDGEQHWQRELGQWVRDVVVAGDALLVATGRDHFGTREPLGTVRAYDRASGDERWRVAVDAEVTQLAPVAGTVFAVASGGTVLALS
jgi:outer membrane protein assembly factor BamB